MTLFFFFTLRHAGSFSSWSFDRLPRLPAPGSDQEHLPVQYHRTGRRGSPTGRSAFRVPHINEPYGNAKTTVMLVVGDAVQ